MDTSKNEAALHKVQALAEITQQTIYLMGASFLLGSLTTLFMLLILDWVRQSKAERAERNG
ncbi:MAG: hypothetical protein ACK502_00905 [Alphaproteobacteria bacterium]